LERTKALMMNSLSLTDHGNLFGALEFYRKANELGIKPVVGCEFYIAPGARTDKSAGSVRGSNYHLTLLAKNHSGYKNLLKMSSIAYLEGFYFRPRIDKELLEEYNDGIICLSGCASGELSRAFLSGSNESQNLQNALEIAKWYRNLFGERYFIEIQNNGLSIQQDAMTGCVEVARQLDIPLVATSDIHYVTREDAEAQDVLLCVNTGKFRTDTNRMRMGSDEFYLRSPDEMYAAFPENEEAVARSQEIADSTELELELGKRHFPVFVPPDGKDSGNYLRELCEEGLKERYADDPEKFSNGKLSKEVIERLDRELSVINKLGFPNYFLIVWDFVRFSRVQGMQATARGSGVGSLVCYALHMSHVCPLKYDLLFERFLDESRLEAPDIDIDFCQKRRGEVIQYVKDKYGIGSVAQIGTFGTLAARAAIRDVGRVLGHTVARVDEVVAKIPDQLGISLKGALETSEEIKEAYDTDSEVREILDFAMQVEGLARNVGTHAAAVVIADGELVDYVPLQRVQGKEEVITQWAMADVERAGLLKMDFLGLRNLTILSKVIEIIYQKTGERIDPYKFSLDDKDTFALLCRGETKGIFQLESGGIRDLLRRMKPDNFRDIIATNALYRPGPLEGGMVDDYIEVKHGRKEAQYPHPIMEDVLHETHGVMVYQEQVMRILNRLGDIQLANSYTCIKAISKKKLPLIAKYREQFIECAREKGLSKNKAEEIFSLIENFAGYGFNKSHSTAYALIAYMTAYLKSHYPVEFMAALLSSDIPSRNFKKKDAMVEHLEDCQRMSIEVVVPKVNLSQTDFAVDSGKILFALSAIKGCGGTASDAIVAERKANGPYRSLFDFCERLDASTVNRSTVETLVKAGAFDDFGAKRSQLMAVVERAIQSGASIAADRRRGQMGFFDNDDESDEVQAAANLPDIEDWEERDSLVYEKEVLGFYLSRHPLDEYVELLSTYCSHSSTTAATLQHRTEVMLGGMLVSIKLSNTKNPRPGNPSRYAMFDLEDMNGLIRCIMWPEQFAQFGEMVSADKILIVRGTIDKRPGSQDANLIVNELIPIDQLETRYTRGISIRVSEEIHGQKGLEQLYEILRGYPGSCDLSLQIQLQDGSRVQCQCDRLKLAINPEMRCRVDQLLGQGNFRLITSTPTLRQDPPGKVRNENWKRKKIDTRVATS